MLIKRIFTDMDGTLLDSRGRLSKNNIDLISKSDIPISLVSARAPMEMKEFIDALGLTGIQVAFNGGLLYYYEHEDLKVIKSQAIQKEDVCLLLKFLSEQFPSISQSYYDKEKWYTYKYDDGIAYESKLTLQKPTEVSIKQYLNPHFDVFKIMLITFNSDEMKQLKSDLENLNLTNITIQQSGEFYLEITHILAKKSFGINFILSNENKLEGITVGFGDGHNDLPMFECVDLAIVMDNAADSIKEKADYIALSNDDDGVGKAIWDFLLI